MAKRIGVVAPGRSIDESVAPRVQALAAIIDPSVEVVFHPQCFAEDGHFAGDDGVRAGAFLEFANDSGFDAIWFARGGYGSNRILDAVMGQLNSAAKAKKYLGYSDMGFMLGALYARRIGRPAHGPMPTEITRKDAGACAARALSWLINDDRRSLEPSTMGGVPAVAFNLSILTIMIGTPWLPDLTDHILMIEDVSEPLYSIDRMLFQLANATQLKGVAGVRVGTFNDIPENDVEFGETLEGMIVRWCGDMGVPYLGPAKIGHVSENYVVPFGVA